MRVLKRSVCGFFVGGLSGAIIGACAGLFDRGSLFIMVPSGPLAWAILGALVGCVGGTLIGPLTSIRSKKQAYQEPRKRPGSGNQIQHEK